MKIYFTAAISDIPAGQQDNYKAIVSALKNLGHRVVAGHILDKKPEQIASQDRDELLEICRKMVAWKNQSDLIVAEVSYPSFGVGQEITYSLTNMKPVIALYLKGRRPNLLTAVGTEYLHLAEYLPDNLQKTLEDFIEYAKETADTRFNFFISPEIEAFLDFISKKKKVPRAVFLRQLIDEDRQKNRKFLEEVGKK